MWNSLNLTLTFINVGISCSRCSFTVWYGSNSHFNPAICVLYHSVLICTSVPHLDHVIHFRSLSSLFEEQHWSLFIRLCGSELFSYRVIMWNWRLQSTHHSLERHELFPGLLLTPTPHPIAQQTQPKLQISSALPQPLFGKPMIRFQLLMPNLLNKLSLCGVYRLEGKREERCFRESLSPYTLEGTTHRHSPLSISHSSFSAPLLTHTVDDAYTHTYKQRSVISHLHVVFSKVSFCAESAVKVG